MFQEINNNYLLEQQQINNYANAINDNSNDPEQAALQLQEYVQIIH
jgi:hypothetical protein